MQVCFQDLGVHGVHDVYDVHGLEIQQTGLKDQIYSAITDLEEEICQEFKVGLLFFSLESNYNFLMAISLLPDLVQNFDISNFKII